MVKVKKVKKDVELPLEEVAKIEVEVELPVEEEVVEKKLVASKDEVLVELPGGEKVLGSHKEVNGRKYIEAMDSKGVTFLLHKNDKGDYVN